MQKVQGGFMNSAQDFKIPVASNLHSFVGAVPMVGTIIAASLVVKAGLSLLVFLPLVF